LVVVVTGVLIEIGNLFIADLGQSVDESMSVLSMSVLASFDHA